MKHLVTIAFISASLFSFGQSYMSNMYWNNYSNFNPAMSGFQYSQHAAATYTNFYPTLSGNNSGVYADYGMNIAKNHGVGIVYSGDFYWTNTNKVLLNYNYQFYFKKAGKLAIGTGLGIGHSKLSENLFGDILPYPEPTTSFELNAGVSYKWKHLLVGFSATNLAAPKQDLLSSYHEPATRYNFHMQYAFQVAEKFQLTPRVLYTNQGGFQQLQPNLTLTYNQQFHLGISSQLRDDFGVNVGWDIKNKFRVAYMFSKTVSKLNYAVSGGVHEFSIGYLINNKPVIRKTPTSPDF